VPHVEPVGAAGLPAFLLRQPDFFFGDGGELVERGELASVGRNGEGGGHWSTLIINRRGLSAFQSVGKISNGIIKGSRFPVERVGINCGQCLDGEEPYPAMRHLSSAASKSCRPTPCLCQGFFTPST
jgi:hypothetical protein